MRALHAIATQSKKDHVVVARDRDRDPCQATRSRVTQNRLTVTRAKQHGQLVASRMHGKQVVCANQDIPQVI